MRSTRYALDWLFPGDPVPAVPEPGTWAMIALGLLVVVFRARQRR